MRFSALPMRAGLVVLGLTGTASAFWRMECRSRSGLARIDPLINPGEISAHAHAIHGGSGFSESATTADLVASDCTSCSVTQDKSAYWHPALYFHDTTTGEFEVMSQDGGMLAYYLLYANAEGDTNIYPFPTDFAMIAGNNDLRNFSDYAVPDIQKSLWTGQYAEQAFLEQAAIGFNCLNYDIAPEGSLYRHFLPDKAYIDANCKDGVRFELMFPSCWNGNATATDHKSHVAYPSEVMTGTCPDTHPKRLVSLFYEIIWRTEDYTNRTGEFVISSGDPTGYGFHGDFIMGWEEDTLQQAVTTCTNPSGEISDCPVFTIQSASAYDACSIATPSNLATDNVVGPMATLPGNQIIQSGPAPATAGTAAVTTPVTSASATSAIVPTLSFSAGVTPSTSATFVPGAVFAVESATAGGEAASVSIPSTTSTTVGPTTTAAPVVVDTQSYFSTDYKTSGYTVNEIKWVEEVETVTIPYTTTATATAINARHVHKHKRHGI